MSTNRTNDKDQNGVRDKRERSSSEIEFLGSTLGKVKSKKGKQSNNKSNRLTKVLPDTVIIITNEVTEIGILKTYKKKVFAFERTEFNEEVELELNWHKRYLKVPVIMVKENEEVVAIFPFQQSVKAKDFVKEDKKIYAKRMSYNDYLNIHGQSVDESKKLTHVLNIDEYRAMIEEDMETSSSNETDENISDERTVTTNEKKELQVTLTITIVKNVKQHLKATYKLKIKHQKLIKRTPYKKNNKHQKIIQRTMY
jgi:hypothetical protein